MRMYVLLFWVWMASVVVRAFVLYDSNPTLPDCEPMDMLSPQRAHVYIPIHHGASDALQSALRAVSDPSSPSYGKYLTAEEVREIVRPPKEYIEAVMMWLRDAGVPSADVDHTEPDLIRVKLSARRVKEMFGAQLLQCRSGAIEVRGMVQIPDHLRHIVPFVTGLRTRPLPIQTDVNPFERRTKKRARAFKNPTLRRLLNSTTDQGIISPKTLEALYNIPSFLYPASSTTQAVIEFLGSGAYEPCDLTGCPKNSSQSKDLGFFNLTGLPNPADDVTIVGPFKPDGGEVEASLDIQYLMTTGRGAPTTYWTEARWMYDFAVDFFSSSKRPDVVSISFSWSEAHQCTQPTGQPNPTCTENNFNSEAYVVRTNDEFQKIGLLGVTLVASSGDDGALGNFGNCTGENQFDPLFPAASPWVTTVGGTMLLKSTVKRISGTCPDVQLKCGDYCTADSECPLTAPCTKCISSVWACGSGCGDMCKSFTDCVDPNCALCHKGVCSADASATEPIRDDCPTAICVQNGGCATSTHEVVCTYPDEAITSGGGFSAYSPMPWYQKNAVGNYTTKNKMPPSSWFNASNRAYPDVSAVAANYGVWMDMWMPTDGTSAAAPVIAGIFSLINSHRVSNGKPKLGFANPLLYTLFEQHPDVFRDVTSGGNMCSSQCCGATGYVAGEGWDATSGLGTIDVGKLIGYLKEY